MPDRDWQMIDAAIRYQALLEAGAPISIGDFVASADPALHAELAEYLEFVLASGQPVVPPDPSAEEGAIAGRVAARAREHFQARFPVPPARTLTEARVARRLSSAALARQIDLPVDLLVRIERGGVQAATLPEKLITRLAGALHYAEAEVRAILAVRPRGTAGVRLSARDGTSVGSETPVAFAEALRASSATPAQRAEWGEPQP